ncbi:hypothetical protein [Umezawaea sp. NPDC059074]|uniref:hypothetical protein n=1 Tax=Umezawaea sp. NPDC059074 TaxID=3346716 RepID=UPI00369C0A00
MDAPTAALIGASLGALATFAGVSINTYVTTRSARREKFFEMRFNAYLRCVRSLSGVSAMASVDELRTILDCIDGSEMGEIHLLTDNVVAYRLVVITVLIRDLSGRVERSGSRSADESGDDSIKAFSRFVIDEINLFVESIREDLGFHKRPFYPRRQTVKERQEFNFMMERIKLIAGHIDAGGGGGK